MAWAQWKKDREYARDLFHLGGKTFMYATMAQFVVGVWFLVMLPRHISHLFLGGDALATLLLIIAVSGAITAIVLVSRGLRTENVRLVGFSMLGIISAVILTMVVIREFVMLAYLKPYFHPEDFAVKTQRSVLPLFLGLFIAGIILWFAMLKRYGMFGHRKLPEQPQV